MDTLYLLGLIASAASMGAIIARGFNPRRWPPVAIAAVLAGVYGHFAAAPWALIVSVVLAFIGVVLPGVLAGRARRQAARGDFGRAARTISPLARFVPRWRDWGALWAATDAWYAGDPAPAQALATQWTGDDARSIVLRETLVGLTRDWSVARFARSVDLQARALCELGAVDAGVETAARVWSTRMSWPAVRRARAVMLAPLAFAGRVDVVDTLTESLRIPRAGRRIWRATALAAAGQPTPAEAELDAVQRTPDLAPAIAHAAAARRAALPSPPVLGSSARAVLADAAREVTASALIRTRRFWQVPSVTAIVSLIVVGYVLQLMRGGTLDGWVALELGALYGEGRLPDEPWRLLAYGFLHFGWLHLGANLLAVIVLGPMVHRAVGGVGTLALFFGGVLIGGLGISYFGALGITIGASAGAMALMGAELAIIGLHPKIRGTRTGRAAMRLGVVLVVLQTGVDAITPMISSAGHIAGGLGGLVLGALWIRLAR